MEEEKEREREEGGKRAAGKPLGAGGREGKRAAGKPLDAGRRKGRRERGKEGSGETAARKKKGEGKEEREEGGKGAAGKPLPAGRREIGGSKKNPLHLVKDGADLLIVGGFGGIT